MAELLEYEPGDLTCIAEGGLRLSALAATLAAHGQRLALDPPGDPTLEECVLEDLSGPRSHRFGRMRDLLLGVTVELADGTLASAGGKVVKNVAGYDLGKLFCGSQGRLGRVRTVSLKLHPGPAAARSLVVPVSDAASASAHLRVVHLSQLVPSAVDLLWLGGLTTGFLALLFEGSERAVDAQLAAAHELVGGEEGDRWGEISAFQAAAGGRVPFERLDRPMLVRAGRAYVEDAVERPWSPLAERIVAAFA